MADYMTLSSDLSDQYREHFENQLLTYAVQATRKAEFGQKAPLPKGVGISTPDVRLYIFTSLLVISLRSSTLTPSSSS